MPIIKEDRLSSCASRRVFLAFKRFQVSVRYDPQGFKFKKMKDEVADAMKEDWKRVLLLVSASLDPSQDTIDDAKKRAITTTASYDEWGGL